MSEEEANLFGTGQEGENDGGAANGTSEKPTVTTQPHATTGGNIFKPDHRKSRLLVEVRSTVF